MLINYSLEKIKVLRVQESYNFRPSLLISSLRVQKIQIFQYKKPQWRLISFNEGQIPYKSYFLKILKEHSLTLRIYTQNKLKLKFIRLISLESISSKRAASRHFKFSLGKMGQRLLILAKKHLLQIEDSRVIFKQLLTLQLTIQDMFRFIDSMTTGVVTTFGSFTRLATPGLNFYIPFIQKMHIISNRLCENHCNIVVRTSDKVFPKLDITIQYKVLPQDSDKAFFQLSEPIQQMISYTDNVVRKSSSSLTLDELFQSQSHIADAIIDEVGSKMKRAGFTIQSAQIRNITPPQQILKSMNDINASQRRKIAAKNDGEATKIKAILVAQAEATEKELRGKGIASMRANITQGWVESVSQMAKKTKTHPQQVLDFLVKVLQQETMQNMAKNAQTKVIFFDKSTGKEFDKNEIIQALEAKQYKGQQKDQKDKK